MGYNEVITYSFIDESLAELVEPKKAQLIFVNNPISENMNIMRPSLLPSLLDTLSYNLNQGIENLKIFEIGTVFQKGKNHKINQKELIGGLISGIITVFNKLSPKTKAILSFPINFSPIIKASGKPLGFFCSA